MAAPSPPRFVDARRVEAPFSAFSLSDGPCFEDWLLLKDGQNGKGTEI